MKWPSVPLRRVTTKVGSGATPRGGEEVYQSSGIPLIRSMNVHFEGFRRKGLVFIDNNEAAQLDHVTVQADDVLFNITGASIGRVTTAPTDMAGARVNQHVCILRTTDALIPQFLAYYLATPAQQAVVNSNQVGGTRQAVTKAMLLNWPVPLPAPKEQWRIAALLQQADGLRRKRTEADALANRILPALFRKMFGDPSANPKGWATENLLRICSPKQWPTISSQELTESGYPVFGANGRIGFYHSYNHEFPTVLITCRGATCGTINICEPKSYVTGNAMALDDPDLNRTSVDFLECFLSIRGLRDTVTGAAQPQITRANLSVVEVLTPPKPLIDAFSGKRQFTGEVIRGMGQAKAALERLFATMLHRAFTGELTARWREAHLKELLAEMEQQARLLNLPRQHRIEAHN